MINYVREMHTCHTNINNYTLQKQNSQFSNIAFVLNHYLKNRV